MYSKKYLRKINGMEVLKLLLAAQYEYSQPKD